MDFITYFFRALVMVLDYVTWLYIWVLVIRALISWVNPDPYNPIVRILVQLTEPVLRPIRRIIPPLGGLDLSVLIATLLVFFLRSWIIAYLYAKLSGGIGAGYHL